MTSPVDRRELVELVGEAKEAGASREKACHELGISLRSYQRWTKEKGEVKTDGRPQAERPEPTNKLTREEREKIRAICNQEAYRSLPPSQIVPALADNGIYMASEATFYRVLREADQLHHRGKAQAPRTVNKPKGYKAAGPNQVWSWDITYLAATITGLFYRLYLVMDVYSRKIVGWEVHESETAAHACVLIRRACLAEGVSVCRGVRPYIVHPTKNSP